MPVTECTVRLPERRRLTTSNVDTRCEGATVHCPIARGARPVTHCLGCPRFERRGAEAGWGYLECRVPGEAFGAGDLCGELVGPEVICFDGELEVTKAVVILEVAGVSSAPVLDDNGVLVGVVSTTALARLRLECRGLGPGLTPPEVEDAMSTELVTLRQQASVLEAASLMVTRNLERVPVVTDDGHLAGVICAMDVVRWLAKRLSRFGPDAHWVR